MTEWLKAFSYPQVFLFLFYLLIFFLTNNLLHIEHRLLIKKKWNEYIIK